MKTPNFKEYTPEQLYDSYNHIDKDKYPEIYRMLINEIKARKLDLSAVEQEISNSFPFKFYIKTQLMMSLIYGIIVIISYFLFPTLINFFLPEEFELDSKDFRISWFFLFSFGGAIIIILINIYRKFNFIFELDDRLLLPKPIVTLIIFVKPFISFNLIGRVKIEKYIKDITKDEKNKY